MRHSEFHRSQHIGWLRAAVLGANDGIVSTASLIIGIAAAGSAHNMILLTSVAGLIAGAMSMAAGEYVSVSSQADTEAADLARERLELATDHENELKELTQIYINRGLQAELAHQVAVQLTEHDALAAHARDELGVLQHMNARPIQAALTSAGTFSVGALLPLLVALMAPSSQTIPYVAFWSLAFLLTLGGLAAKVGGANITSGALRVTFWGVLAMVATATVGRLLGVALA
ncbi:MAG: VIT1/CCC1 transporter family protein [Methylophilaceae bacterium]